MTARFFPDPDAEQRLDDLIDRSRAARARVSADSQLAQRVTELRRAYPDLGGSAVALAKAGLGPDSPAVRRAAEVRAVKKRKKTGGFSLGSILKGTVRAGLTALSAPLEELQGVIRGAGWGGVRYKDEHGHINPFDPEYWGSMWDGVTKAGRSSGFKAVEDLVSGDRVDLGSGYFPGGAIAKEQKRDSERLQLNGQPVSTGRVIARRVTEPGTDPYNVLSGLVDAGIAFGGDPLIVAGAGVAQAQRARKLFVHESAGLVNGTRKTVLPNLADEWLASKSGRKVVDRVAETNTVPELRRLLGDKVDVETLVELADTRTADEVRNILRPKLGVTIREKPHIGRFAPRVRRTTENIRLLQQMPSAGFLIDDADQSVRQMENMLRNAKMPGEVVDDFVERMARANGRPEKFKVITDSYEAMNLHLAGKIPAAKAQKMTRAWQNHYEELSRYFVDEIGENAPVLGATINGAEKSLPTPHLFNEYINQFIPSPDARAVRKMTSRYGRILEKPGLSITTTALDFVSQDVWKPLTLLRGAWTVRVVGEEQVRMAFSGLDSILNHPIRAIVWATGRKGNIDVFGKEWDVLDEASEFARSQSQHGGGWRDRVVAAGKTVFRRDEDLENYVKGWQGELSQLANDPIAKRVAGGWAAGDKVPGGLSGNHVEDAKRWFWEGPGKKFRLDMSKASGREALAVDRAVADGYIDSVFKRIQIKTGDDARLIDGIATGKINNQALADKSVAVDLEALAMEGIGPQAVKGDITLIGKTSLGGELGGKLDKATDFLFTNLMSKPTNFLSRAPAFKQFYWKRIEELVPFMDDAAAQRAIATAEKAGLSRGQIKRMRDLAARGGGDLQLEDATLIAKGFGLEQTKKLLYDLTQRSQWADVTRVVFPFAEAWKEILTAWARIGTEHPIAIRRLQQGIEGARGAGWFQRDDVSGEEVFVYPGSQFFTEKITGALTGGPGIPVPFQGSVAGLNLFSDQWYMPGFGPVVQASVGKIIPNKPDFDWLREMVVPYGEQDTSKGFLESFAPSWLQKFRVAIADPESDKTFGNAVFDVARYLVSTGEYSTDTVDEQIRLSQAATSKGRLLFILRALAQAGGAPSSPRFKWMARDKNGDLITAFKLGEEFRKLEERVGYDEATFAFLDMFGENALLYLQPKSRGGFSPTEELHRWVRDNPGLVSKYKNTYGFFAPAEGDFAITELDRQIASGEREALTPREAVELANHRVASMKYRLAREKAGDRPSKATRAWLDRVKDALVSEYPGYKPELFEIGKTDVLVRELREIATEPAVLRTGAGQGLVKYLEARDKAMEAARQAGVKSFAQAKSMRSVRAWLRQVGVALTAENPEFTTLWERVFEREMVDDEEVAA